MFRTGNKTDPAPPLDLIDRAPAAPERAAEVPIPIAPAERLTTVLGRGVAFDGTLRFESTLHIDGTFSGHITAGQSLVIGEGANVTADVSCDSISVSGQLRGSLTATTAIELRPAARVNADLTAPSLSIEKGASFEGHVTMGTTATGSEAPSDAGLPTGFTSGSGRVRPKRT